LLDAVEQTGHRQDTIIVFVGDNGWHLGQKEHWAKSALWKEATRVPMIWVAPGLTKPGSECQRAVDLTSIYPTLCELAGVPTPKHAEGISIKPLLSDPAKEWKQPAISTFLRNNHAICTDHWRYIRYADGSEELYDEKVDPNEWSNQAAKPELASVKKELGAFLPTVNAKPVPHSDNPKKTNKRKHRAE
jgi:arylsulfatase A-like enzyme